jgi:hypothetical protein
MLCPGCLCRVYDKTTVLGTFPICPDRYSVSKSPILNYPELSFPELPKRTQRHPDCLSLIKYKLPDRDKTYFIIKVNIKN